MPAAPGQGGAGRERAAAADPSAPHGHPRSRRRRISRPSWSRKSSGAYGAANLGYTGAGQTIAILIDTFPINSDLTAFWSHNNIPQTLSNIQKMQAVAGTLPATSGEETLDTEWTSGIASGATIRIYATHDLNFSSLDKGLQRILTDLPSQPNLHQLSISLGLGETEVSNSQLQTDAQYFAELANAGVSVFVSSGDDGSEPRETRSLSPPISPATQRHRGGRHHRFTSIPPGRSAPRPPGTAAAAASADSSRGRAGRRAANVPSGHEALRAGCLLRGGSEHRRLCLLQGAAKQIGGTSWSAPTWAGFCALINQARAQNGLGPIGLLNPKIYPLLGTACFRDITPETTGATPQRPGTTWTPASAARHERAPARALRLREQQPRRSTSFSPAAGPVGTNVT